MLGIRNLASAGTRRADELVGRQREMALAAEALDGVAAGKRQILVISGEPGIGKTRLISELLAQATQRDFATLSGRAAEFERDLPFAVFADALNSGLAASDMRELAELPQDVRGNLGAIFPGLSQLADKTPARLQAERHHSYHAVGAMLQTLAKNRPLVLALDDLHWADEASVELLAHILRRMQEAPVLLVLAFRPHRGAPQLDAALLEAQREGNAELLGLEPLTEQEASQLLHDGVDRASLARIYEAAGGNPFYLEQLARSTAQQSLDSRSGSGEAHSTGVPSLVSASLAREIADLSDGTRIALQAAAVLGDSFEPELIAATADTSEAEALEAIDQLLALDLIRPTEVPRCFRFRHPLVRSAVYESCNAGWRISAHMRAAAELERRDAPAPLRAHHVERSAKAGDEQAISLLTDAANTTAPRAPAVAAGWYEAALRLLPETQENVERRLHLLVPLGIALGSTDRLEDSREVLRRVLDLLPAELTPLRGAALSFNSTVEILLGNSEQARSDLADALERADDQHSPFAAELRSGIAISCFFSPDLERMRDFASQAVEDFGDIDGPVPAVAAGALAVAEYGLGNIPASRESLDKAASRVNDLSDEQAMWRPAAFLWIGWAELLLERFDDAERHFERGIVVSRAGGQEHLLVQMMQGAALAKMWRGDLDGATELLDAAIESSLLSGHDLFLTVGFGARCWIEAANGNPSEAVKLGERALRAANASKALFFRKLAVCALAEALLECGEAQRCRDLLVAELGEPDLPLSRGRALCLLANAEIALGDVKAAELWADEAQHVAGEVGLGLVSALAKRARASVLVAQGAPADAVALALESAQDAESVDAPVEAARSRTVAGTALAQSGDRQGGLDLLDTAQSELARYHAAGPQAQAVRELRRLGRRVHSRGRPGDGLGGLTARELEVAKLAADAKKNREIAAELFISEKTVEQHLGRVFAKLGVSSRVAVAGALERLSTGE